MKGYISILYLTLLLLLISCSTYPELGDGYRLDSDGKYTLEIVNSQNNVMVGSHILDYAFDSTFIVVSQRPWDDPSIPGLKEMTFYKRREAFENSTFRQYWIINKKEKGEYSLDTSTGLAKYSNIYGPFTKEKYLQKCRELNVSVNLQLK